MIRSNKDPSERAVDWETLNMLQETADTARRRAVHPVDPQRSGVRGLRRLAPDVKHHRGALLHSMSILSFDAAVVEMLMVQTFWADSPVLD